MPLSAQSLFAALCPLVTYEGPTVLDNYLFFLFVGTVGFGFSRLRTWVGIVIFPFVFMAVLLRMAVLLSYAGAAGAGYYGHCFVGMLACVGLTFAGLFAGLRRRAMP
ncbi:MAG TPA: hypothetical protein VGV38_14770 [Pyrinomonadaceae bacterium]|nr:hypothetical protein [Pyrinomonadaceae bacterium]